MDKKLDENAVFAYVWSMLEFMAANKATAVSICLNKVLEDKLGLSSGMDLDKAEQTAADEESAHEGTERQRSLLALIVLILSSEEIDSHWGEFAIAEIKMPECLIFDYGTSVHVWSA